MNLSRLRMGCQELPTNMMTRQFTSKTSTIEVTNNQDLFQDCCKDNYTYAYTYAYTYSYTYTYTFILILILIRMWKGDFATIWT